MIMIPAFVLAVFLLWIVLSQFFGRRVVLVTSLAIVFGTNFFWLLVHEGPEVHLFLFILFLAMIRLTFLWQRKKRWLPLVAMLPVMLLVSLLSLPGMLIMLFPVLAVVWHIPLPRGGGVRGGAHWRQLFFLAGSFVLCFYLRKFPWFSSPGEILYFGSSQAAQFPIMPANIHRVLFSFKNGWLVYTPLMIPAITGFYLLAEKNRGVYFAAFLFFLGCLIYVASIPKWWYNNGFGYPNLIETYAVLAIPLGYTIQWMWQKHRGARIFLVTLLFMLACLNVFQTWQFQKSIILPERMTGSNYLAAFGKTSIAGQDMLLTESNGSGLSYSIPGDINVQCKVISKFDFEKPDKEWDAYRSGRFAHTGKYSLRMNPEFRFSPGLVVPISRLTPGDSTWIRATASFYYTCAPDSNIVFMVITCLHHGAAYKYRATELMAAKFSPNRWNNVSMSYQIPLPSDKNDSIHVYFWNYGGEDCYIDDFVIDLCKPTNQP